jgi:hypothetical protein
MDQHNLRDIVFKVMKVKEKQRNGWFQTERTQRGVTLSATCDPGADALL